MPTVQFGKRPGRTRGRPGDRATADGRADISYGPIPAKGGVTVVADVQTVTSDATGGTFTLGTAGDVTGTIAWNAAMSVVETAIETLDEYTAATVTGSDGGPWIITSNDGAGLPGETLVVDNTLATGGTAVNVHTTVGVANVYEAFALVTEGDTGSFTIVIDGNASAAIDEDDDADAIEILVEGITGITAVECTGLGTRISPFIVTFSNPAGDVDTASTVTTGWSSTIVDADRQVAPGDRQ